MYLFVSIVMFALTYGPHVVRSDFCTRYASAERFSKSKDLAWAVHSLKFIVTKNISYLYLGEDKSKGHTESVYEFDVSCTTPDKCPKIGAEQEFSKVFNGLKDLKNAFIQDGITYLFTESSPKVFIFENTTQINSIDEKDFWRNTTHSTVYKWKNNVKTVLSKFIPPITPSGPPRYAFSFDSVNSDTDGTITVEVQGNYERVNIVKNNPNTFALYTFGDYLVPVRLGKGGVHSYLSLPNGDIIFNMDHKPCYFRKGDVMLYFYYAQDLNKMFGCGKELLALNDRILSDTRSDNLSPLYFMK